MQAPKGKYLAVPREWSVSRTGPNNLPTFVCLFDLTHILQGPEWAECAADQLEATGYFYLIKTDGEPNDFTIKALSHALGWDGRTFSSLNDGQWGAVTVQLTLDEEEYQGKKKVKIQYINHRDDVGGAVPKGDPQEVKSLDQMYGPKLRAVAGKNGATTKPAATPAATPEGQARTQAWKEFCLKTSEMTDKDVRATAWKESLVQFFGDGVEQGAVNAGQWNEFTTSLRTTYEVGTGFPLSVRKQPTVSPIGDEKQFKEEDIPF